MGANRIRNAGRPKGRGFDSFTFRPTTARPWLAMKHLRAARIDELLRLRCVLKRPALRALTTPVRPATERRSSP